MPDAARQTIKLTIRGAVACGKTALAHALLERPFKREYQATLGAVVMPWPRPDAESDVVLWDLEGELATRPAPYAYLIGSALILHVADASKPDWPDQFDRLEDNRAPQATPILRVLSKADLSDDAPDHDRLRQLAQRYLPIAITSASKGHGLDDLQTQILNNLDAGFG